MRTENIVCVVMNESTKYLNSSMSVSQLFFLLQYMPQTQVVDTTPLKVDSLSE